MLEICHVRLHGLANCWNPPKPLTLQFFIQSVCFQQFLDVLNQYDFALWIGLFGKPLKGQDKLTLNRCTGHFKAVMVSDWACLSTTVWRRLKRSFFLVDCRLGVLCAPLISFQAVLAGTGQLRRSEQLLCGTGGREESFNEHPGTRIKFADVSLNLNVLGLLSLRQVGSMRTWDGWWP